MCFGKWFGFFFNGTMYRIPFNEQVFITESKEDKEMTKTTKTNAAKTTIEQPGIAGFPGAPEPKATKAPSKKAPKRTVAEIKETWYKGAELVAKMYGNAQIIDTPKNPGNENGIVNRDPKWNEAVRYIAAEFGWTDNRFVYGGVINANGGKVKPGAYGVPSFIGGMFRPVYNVDDVEWPGGKVPTEWKKAERTSKGKSGKGKGKGGKRTEAPKTKAPEFSAEYEKLKAELAEQKAANAALAAQIAAINENTNATTAILAALAGKLGI